MINESTAKESRQLHFDSLDRFYKLAPNKPYCTNDTAFGLRIRQKKTAFKHSHIQHNPPSMQHWLTFDIDHDNYFQWEKAGLPDPNLIVRNLHNRKHHLSYAIESVCTSDAAHTKPINYLSAIQEAYTELLKADTCYTGLITKNPLHSDFQCQHLHDREYSLGELADYVDLKPKRWTRKRAANENHYGLGRNSALFHRLRYWAYDNVNHHQQEGSTYNQWMLEVLEKAGSFNDFHEALPYQEIKSTAKSVGKWVWTKYDPENKGKRVRRGAMSAVFDGSQIDLDLTARQRLSARQTNETRKKATEEKIIQAIGQLTATGTKVTQKAVAVTAGLGIATVKRNWARFKR